MTDTETHGPAPTVQPPVSDQASTSKEKSLPKLSASEFRQYNRLAEKMDYFHEEFRETWKLIIAACEKNKRPHGMSIRQFLAMGEEFVTRVTLHHTVEEQRVYPVLAKRMPAFKEELDLLGQHELIHQGLERLGSYLRACSSGEKELRMSELKAVMDSFGKTLWEHLDDEVEQLGAKYMRQYWTLDEMRRLPM